MQSKKEKDVLVENINSKSADISENENADEQKADDIIEADDTTEDDTTDDEDIIEDEAVTDDETEDDDQWYESPEDNKNKKESAKRVPAWQDKKVVIPVIITLIIFVTVAVFLGLLLSDFITPIVDESVGSDSTTDTSGSDNTGESDESSNDQLRLEIREEAQRILQLLLDYPGDDFSTYFTDVMIEYSEDPGSLSNQNGYLFEEGNMVQEFYDATAALEVGQISGLVETYYGYHIIYRIPINLDETPIGLLSQGDTRTLRTIMAMEAFYEKIALWNDELDPDYSEDFHSLDIVDLITFSLKNDNGTGSASLPGELSLTDIDFDLMFSMFTPDTRMISKGDFSVTWAELFSNIFNNLSNVYSSLGVIPDLTVPYSEEMPPLGELLMEYSVEDSLRNLSIVYNADRLGIKHSEEEIVLIDNHINDMLDLFGSEEDFYKALWDERGIYEVDLYIKISMATILPYVIFRELYGEQGELYPADEALKRAEDAGFLMAKHILIAFK